MGRPVFTPLDLKDVKLDRLQAALATALASLDARLDAVAAPPVAVTGRDYKVTDESVVDYRGPGGHSVTLPAAASNGRQRGRTVYVLNNGTGAIIVRAAGRDTINDTAAVELTAGAAMTAISDGDAGWLQTIPPVNDHKVAVTVDDTAPDYLGAKLVGGDNVTLTVLDPGGAEAVRIDVSTEAASDHKVSVSGTDATADYLLAKVEAGTGITVAQAHPGSAETVRISGDGKVLATATDTTRKVLRDKLIAGTNVTITTTPGSGDQSVRIDASGTSQVAVTGADTTPGYLFDKLVAGQDIGLTVFHPGGNEAVLVDAKDHTVASTSGSYTMNPSDYVVSYTGSGGHTVTLPAATAGGSGRARPRVILNNGTGTVTISRAGSDTVDQTASVSLAAGAMAIVVPDGSTKFRTMGAPAAGLLQTLYDPANTPSGVQVYTSNTPANGNVFEVTSEQGRHLQVRKHATLATAILHFAGGMVINGVDGLTISDSSVAGVLAIGASGESIRCTGAGAGITVVDRSNGKLAFLGGTPRGRYTGQSLLSHVVDDAVPAYESKINQLVDLLNEVVRCLSAEEGFALMNGPV